MIKIALSPYESPCKGCQKRTVEPNCHSTCPEYLAFREKIDQGAMDKAIQCDINNYQSQQVYKGKHRQLTHTWKHYRSRMD